MTTFKTLSFVAYDPATTASSSAPPTSVTGGSSYAGPGVSLNGNASGNDVNGVNGVKGGSVNIKQVRMGPRSPSPPLLNLGVKPKFNGVNGTPNGLNGSHNVNGANGVSANGVNGHSKGLLNLTPLASTSGSTTSLASSRLAGPSRSPPSPSRLAPGLKKLNGGPPSIASSTSGSVLPPSPSNRQPASSTALHPLAAPTKFKPTSSPVRPGPTSLRVVPDQQRRAFSSPGRSPPPSSSPSSTPGPSEPRSTTTTPRPSLAPALQLSTPTKLASSTATPSPSHVRQPQLATPQKRAANGKAQSNGLVNGARNKDSLYDGPVILSWPESITAPKAAGLHNGSMACYANATLQVILHTPPVLRLVLAHDASSCILTSRKKYCVVCALREMTTGAHWTGTKKAYRPAIQNNLFHIKKGFSKNRQEDTHEFFRFVTDALQASALAGYPKDLPHKIKHTTWVHRIWGGQVRSRVLCLSCKKPSDTFDTFLDLSLDVTARQQTVAGLMDGFVREDRLDGDNKYNCENCKKKSVATKSMRIAEAPPILTLHLKRFGVSPTSWNGRLQKVNTAIAYPALLDLAPWMTERGSESPRYRLFAVTSHHGTSMTYGHYTSYVRGPKGTWYHADDDEVSPVEKKEVLSDRAAYLLSYIRIPAGKEDALPPSAPGTPNGKRKIDQVEQEEEEEEAEEGSKRTPNGYTGANGSATAKKVNGVNGVNGHAGPSRVMGPQLPPGHPAAVRRIAPVLLNSAAENQPAEEEKEEEQGEDPTEKRYDRDTDDDDNEDNEHEDVDDETYELGRNGQTSSSALERLMSYGDSPPRTLPSSSSKPTHGRPLAPFSPNGKHHFHSHSKRRKHAHAHAHGTGFGSPSSNVRKQGRSGAPMPYKMGTGGVLGRGGGGGGGGEGKRLKKGMRQRMKGKGK